MKRRPNCRVCQHPDVDRLDERLALFADTPAGIAVATGIPAKTVWLHLKHLPSSWADEYAAHYGAGAAITLDTIKNRMWKMSANIEDLAYNARSERTRVEAGNSFLGYMNSSAKLTGDEPIAEWQTVTGNPQLIEVVSWLLDAVAELPGGRPLVDQALMKFGIDQDDATPREIEA